MHDEPFDPTPPRAAAIVESLRAFGYDLPTALADLVDNSLSAGARHVWVRFEWAGAASVISVTDDGHGMTGSELIEAMRLGGGGPLAERKPHDLGRFGLGLKTASLSQCRRLTVRSRRAGMPAPETRCWDLDVIAARDDWRLLRAAEPAAEPHFARLATLPAGTTVLWQHLDRLTRGQDAQNERHQRRFHERIEETRRHLGMVFHRLMTGPAGVRLVLNERPVEPWDPFLEQHPATTRLSDQVNLDGVPLPVRAFVLPHFSKLTPADHTAGAGPRGWLAHQGFYIYRRERLLVAGDWLGFGDSRDAAWRKEEHLKLARIAVDLPNTLDYEWQINVTKSRATPPLAVRDRLRGIAENVRARARAVYTHRGAQLVPRATAPAHVHLWAPVAKHARVFYQINPAHPLVIRAVEVSAEPAALRTLLRLLQETLPLQHISIGGVERPDSQPAPFEGAVDTEIQDAMRQLYALFLVAGQTPEEARRRLAQHSPFDQFPALVAALA
jgi:hypothetical protein